MEEERGKAGLVPVSLSSYLQLRLPALKLGNVPWFPALSVSFILSEGGDSVRICIRHYTTYFTLFFLLQCI